MADDLILEFSRFEFKYVLHKSLREAVEAELGYFMQLDPFVESANHNRYPVRSLYFDDASHTAFYDKIDGLKTRSKFRIRTYTRDNGHAPVFLEEKGRYDNRVFKHRALISDSGKPVTTSSLIDTLLARDLPDNDLLDNDLLAKDLLANNARNETLNNKFRYTWFRKRIRPVALIDYMRRPYISKYDHEFRVTFDEKLMATKSDELFPDNKAVGKLLLPGYTVMEVKFGYKVPAWFHKIIQSYELKRVPLSKICEGMKRLHIAIDL